MPVENLSLACFLLEHAIFFIPVFAYNVRGTW